ncbi:MULTISPECIES: ROK family transcriptional regulator [Paeniglutamicibacter]|uniref:NBD/HSP70 family sugar kinase n=1 Tax=Paeniglutamicibacter sulfureus TaxID=43666 RepID=A0ABU2BJG1_9MICC|nr:MULTISPECIES: ROK family transcriptional regulator [Paeniglutamicibacter]MCV9993220.1 ROK family transcriptional regulator [Paeniglutamicibacter sp. ZC-3]MDR7357853.1 putative NBD/HSP70 family sugar kinase [Paeniglutamicibacter sulfureus]
MQRGTNLGRLGDFNQAVIFESIRRAVDGVSRVELAGSTGLSPQTISNVVRRLLDEGLVREDRTIVSGPGKPRTVLELESNRMVAVGIHLDPGVITVVILNLRGEILHSRRLDIPAVEVPEKTIETMATTVDEIISESGVPRSNVLGVGVVVPGPLDPERGVMIDPPLLDGWKDVDMVGPLHRLLKLDVIIEKDTIAASIAEQWKGNDAERDNFVTMYVGAGIGAGMVLNGEIHRGISNNAGEIGHYSTGVISQDCNICGRNDCLHASLSFNMIAQQARERGLNLTAPDDGNAEERAAGMNEIVALAQSGNEVAVELIRECMGHVGQVAGQLCNTLDVGLVILAGPLWAEVDEWCLEDVRAIINERFSSKHVHAIEVRSSTLGHEVGAIGGACAIMDASLSPKAAALLLR